RGKPARARVHLTRHAFAGGADAEREREGRVWAVGDEGVELRPERQDDDALTGDEREDLAGQRGGRRAGAVTGADVVGQVVVDVEDHDGERSVEQRGLVRVRADELGAAGGHQHLVLQLHAVWRARLARVALQAQ